MFGPIDAEGGVDGGFDVFGADVAVLLPAVVLVVDVAAGGVRRAEGTAPFDAGAGVKGGRALGSTNSTGSDVDNENYGWKQNRYIRPEDVEATVYSALGIDWTKQLDTPFGRTFEYVPYAADGLYLPIDELWA